MFPRIQDSSQSGARFNQIEFIASKRLLWAWFAWLGVVLGLIVLADLGWEIRCLAVLTVAAAGRVARRFIGLRGTQAVRAIAWCDAGPVFRVRLGASADWIEARLTDCRQYGAGLWLIHFHTSVGQRGLAVDTGLQDPVNLRRLARTLEGLRGLRPGAWKSGTDTIPAQGLKCITRR